MERVRGVTSPQKWLNRKNRQEGYCVPACEN
jgi:hypothetical protein